MVWNKLSDDLFPQEEGVYRMKSYIALGKKYWYVLLIIGIIAFAKFGFFANMFTGLNAIQAICDSEKCCTAYYAECQQDIGNQNPDHTISVSAPYGFDFRDMQFTRWSLSGCNVLWDTPQIYETPLIRRVCGADACAGCGMNTCSDIVEGTQKQNMLIVSPKGTIPMLSGFDTLKFCGYYGEIIETTTTTTMTLNEITTTTFDWNPTTTTIPSENLGLNTSYYGLPLGAWIIIIIAIIGGLYWWKK